MHTITTDLATGIVEVDASGFEVRSAGTGAVQGEAWRDDSSSISRRVGEKASVSFW